MNRRAGQRGMALLTAVMLVALASILAVGIAFDSAMTARRAAGGFSVEQGLQLAAAAEGAAGWLLREDLRPRRGGNPSPTDHPGENWNARIPPVEIAPGITLEAQIDDEQGKFNLNTLIDAQGNRNQEAVQIFEWLLELQGLERKWAGLMVDWLDENINPESDGGEDNLYTLQDPPFRTANTTITTPSELMHLPGFDREMYLRLLPHVTALPPMANRINRCFATPALLDAIESAYTGTLTETWTRQDPQTFAQSRQGGCYPPLQAIVGGISNATAKQQAENLLVDRTTYFRLRTWVTIGTTRFALYSLLERDPSGEVRPLLRTFGTE